MLSQARIDARTWEAQGRTDASIEARDAEWNGIYILLPLSFSYNRWKVHNVTTLFLVGKFESLGTSNERTSSIKRRDGLSIQAWQLWGENELDI